MVEFGIVLGFDSLGAVERSVRYLKSCAMAPFIVLNESGADYSELPDELILRSSNVNSNHRELISEISDRLGSYSKGDDWKVSAVVNFQDRMWICYLDIRKAFPTALGIKPSVVMNTSIKPNLRHLTTGTRWEVPYALIPEETIRSNSLLSFPPLQQLMETCQSLIVKPVMGMGGEGVTRINRNEYERNLTGVLTKLIERQKDIFKDEIVGDFLQLNEDRLQPINRDGDEFSIEGVADEECKSKHIVVQKKTRREEYPVFRDMEYLAVHPYPEESALLSCTNELLKIVGFKTMPFHIEMKLSTEGDAKPIEFNPRMGGGSIVDLMNISQGLDIHF